LFTGWKAVASWPSNPAPNLISGVEQEPKLPMLLVGLATALEMVVEEGTFAPGLDDPAMGMPVALAEKPTETVLAAGSAVNVAAPETVTVTAVAQTLHVEVGVARAVTRTTTRLFTSGRVSGWTGCPTTSSKTERTNTQICDL